MVCETYNDRGFVTQGNLLCLQSFNTVIVGNNALCQAVLLRILHVTTVLTDKVLYRPVTRVDDITEVVNLDILGIDLFKKMRDFGGEVCDCNCVSMQTVWRWR